MSLIYCFLRVLLHSNNYFYRRSHLDGEINTRNSRRSHFQRVIWRRDDLSTKTACKFDISPSVLNFHFELSGNLEKRVFTHQIKLRMIADNKPFRRSRKRLLYLKKYLPDSEIIMIS